MMQSPLAIESEGVGDSVVFIHGLGGTSNVFQPQVDELSPHFRCLRLDLPGAGRSAYKSKPSIGSLSHTVLDLIQQECGDIPVHIVAHSMGSVIAQDIAFRSANSVRSIALIGPLHEPSEKARQALRDRAVAARSEGMLPIAKAIIQGSTAANTRGTQAAAIACIREMLMAQNVEGYASHCEALASATGVRLGALTHPVLLITGDEDRTAPPASVESMAAALPNSTLRIVGRCGHWATLERPNEINEALVNFLLAQKL